MTFRLAAYGVCLSDEGVLLVRDAPTSTWSLPGGGVEHGEDPFDTVIREIAEETGYEAVVERLLGVDSCVIPRESAWSGAEHQNVGVFYRVRVVGGERRPELNGATTEPAWVPIVDTGGLRRSSLVDVGLKLAATQPATGHVGAVPVGGLVQY